MTWENEFFHVIAPRNKLVDLHLRWLENVLLEEIYHLRRLI